MATAAPPVRPRAISRTNLGNRKYWTLHSGINNVWACRPGGATSSVVAFRNLDDAVLVGCMIETHYMNHKEWPDFDASQITLPSAQIEDLKNIFLQKWEFDDLKLICTRNMLDMISVDEINKRQTAYSFTGSHYKFGADIIFYQNRFNELLNI